MTLRNAYGHDKFVLSFELFPPKTPAGEDELFRHLPDLVAFEPGYITCTYGAGGSTRAKTLDVVTRVSRQFGVPVASHLTCVGATIDDLRGYLAEAQRLGIQNIVALRGDPPRGQAEFQPLAGGFRYAHELVTLLRREFSGFGVAVAGYPEIHQEAAGPQADLDHLKFKVDCGADVVITQLFYDNGDFFRFEERCRRAGIRVPIVPGVLPITNLAQVRRITTLCGARLPEALLSALEAHEERLGDQFEVGVDHATRQVQELLDARVPGVHFYVLNKSPATCRVLRAVARPA
jgi:methylenetetrahydrofolate reductase (NADPH)